LTFQRHVDKNVKYVCAYVCNEVVIAEYGNIAVWFDRHMLLQLDSQFNCFHFC